MRLVFIDHYDSFSNNLIDWLSQSNRIASIEICFFDKTDQMNKASRYLEIGKSLLVLSPGPHSPEKTPLTNKLVKKNMGKIPILGICLGHQIIGHVLGCKIGPVKNPRHGLTRNIIGKEDHQVFKDITFPLKMAAYNSLGINSLSQEFYSQGWEVLCECENKEIQGIARLQLPLAPVLGFQFHPESFLSEQSDILHQNLMDILSKGQSKSSEVP